MHFQTNFNYVTGGVTTLIVLRLGVWPQVEERLLASSRSTSLALTMPSGSMDGTVIYLIDFSSCLTDNSLF